MTYSKEVYDWRKSHNICASCGVEYAAAGTRCHVCAANIAEKKYIQYHGMTYTERRAFLDRRNQRRKELRAERKEKGLCLRCGKLVYNGSSLCREHYIQRKRYDEKHKKTKKTVAGGCRCCGKDVVKGKKLCEEHLLQYQEIMQRNSCTVGGKE